MPFVSRQLHALCRCLILLCPILLCAIAPATTANGQAPTPTRASLPNPAEAALARQMMKDARQWASRGWSEPARRLALRAQRLQVAWRSDETTPAQLLSELDGVHTAALEREQVQPQAPPKAVKAFEQPLALETNWQPGRESSSVVAMAPHSIAMIDVHMAPTTPPFLDPISRTATPAGHSLPSFPRPLEPIPLDLRQSPDAKALETVETDSLSSADLADDRRAAAPVIVNQSSNAIALICFLAGSLCGIAAVMPWFRNRLAKSDSVMRVELISPLHAQEAWKPIIDSQRSHESESESSPGNSPRREVAPSDSGHDGEASSERADSSAPAAPTPPRDEPQAGVRSAIQGDSSRSQLLDSHAGQPSIDFEAALLQMAVDNNLALRRRLAEQGLN